jgi:hypothetical protein
MQVETRIKHQNKLPVLSVDADMNKLQIKYFWTKSNLL